MYRCRDRTVFISLPALAVVVQVNAKICGLLENGSDVIIFFRSYMDIKEISFIVNAGFVGELEN